MKIEESFVPLSLDDIEEKVRINQEQNGYDLMGLKEMLEFELSLVQRDILKYIHEGKMIHIESHIQAQNLREQIAYITNKITRDLLKWQPPIQPQS